VTASNTQTQTTLRRQTDVKKKAKILAVGPKHVMFDSARTMELHLIRDNPHNTSIIMAWLPGRVSEMMMASV